MALRNIVVEGDEIVIGGDETYKALCYNCYNELKKGLINEKENATT